MTEREKFLFEARELISKTLLKIEHDETILGLGVVLGSNTHTFVKTCGIIQPQHDQIPIKQ